MPEGYFGDFLKGLFEGFDEGKYSVKLDVAKKLMEIETLSLEQISSVTELSVEDLLKLKNE